MNPRNDFQLCHTYLLCTPTFSGFSCESTSESGITLRYFQNVPLVDSKSISRSIFFDWRFNQKIDRMETILKEIFK